MLFVGLVLLLCGNSYGQSLSKTDSAQKVLETRDLSDVEIANTLSYISRRARDPDEKIEAAKRLINVAEKIDDYKKQVAGYIDLGYGLKLKGDLDKSLATYLDAAKIAGKNNDPILEGDVYTNIAGVYNSNENYTNSITYYQKALSLYGNEIDSLRLAGIYINYGYASYKAGLYDSAINQSRRAIAYSGASEFALVKAYAQANLALALAKKDRFNEADTQLEKAIKLMESQGDKYGLSDCLIEIGGIYVHEGRLADGINKLERGYKIALEHDLKEQIQNGAKHLFYAFQQLGELGTAIHYQTQYYQYRDSLINAKQIRKLADLRTEHEVGRKQAELDLITAEKRNQQIILYAIAGGAVLVFALLAVVYKNYRDKNKINKILEQQKKQLEALNQTKDKFFSIVSHDLRGPVSAFSGISRLIKYAAEDKNEDELVEIADHIDETTSHLSGLLDNLLNWAMQQQGHFPYIPEKLNLKELLEEIAGIFQNMARSKQIDLIISAADNVEIWADRNTTMTILRNLTNNALKFTPEGGAVNIIGDQEGEYVKISVKDTGIGMSPEKLQKLFDLEDKQSKYGTAGEKGLGLGLQLVQEFVELNKGEVEVKSVMNKGSEFIIKLPLFETSKQQHHVDN